MKKLREAAKEFEDDAKRVGRDIERAVRHAADGIGDEIEERTGEPVRRDWFRAALVFAVVVVFMVVGMVIRAYW